MGTRQAGKREGQGANSTFTNLDGGIKMRRESGNIIKENPGDGGLPHKAMTSPQLKKKGKDRKERDPTVGMG